ncbi:O-antigen ligase family protein [Oribacterium sp. FC2011]|uniref:O-antigen ligase family protein n=1 Tax=Oribacterium sp. FC2011 TaxID=1408311 RepID=UPI0004E107CF|nr:O-antigen ligase family protein [Oribacterium sp. FC2011]
MSDSMFEIIKKTEEPETALKAEKKQKPETTSKSKKSKDSSGSGTKTKQNDLSSSTPAPGKTTKQLNRIFGNITRWLMDIYVLFYLCIFALCTHEKYFDILTFRYHLYWKPTLIYGAVFLGLGLFYLLADTIYNKSAIRRGFFASLKKGGWKRYISKVDIAFFALIVIFGISTAFARYQYEAFWGNRGRSQGLFLWLVFFVTYILVTRFYRFKRWHIYAYMGFASLVCLWGISNFFLYTWGMFEGADEMFKYKFVSSIGNINNYTNFTGMLFGAAAVLFITGRNKWESLYSWLILVIASFAQIMGKSDNAILSTAAVIAFTPFLWEKSEHIMKHLLTIFTYLAAMKITASISAAGIQTMHDIDPGTQIEIGGKSIITYILLLLLIFAIVFALHAKKVNTLNPSNEEKTVKHAKTIWNILLACGVLTAIAILIAANTGWHPEFWESYKGMLIFNDEWGTGRGLAWRLGMEYWTKDSILFTKLFGYGPDTYYIITMDRFMNIMQNAGYGIFDSAHNEYFEYFITVGVFGLIAYIALMFTSLKQIFKSGEITVKAAGMAVLAYVIQAVVNIAIPITTPVFMLLIFVGLAGNRSEK